MLFFSPEEDMALRTLFEAKKGPPHTNKVKQYEIVFSFKVSLFIQFVKA